MAGIEPGEIDGILVILREMKELYGKMLEFSLEQNGVFAVGDEKRLFELISEKNRILNLVDERSAELAKLKEKWNGSDDIDPARRAEVEDAYEAVRASVERVIEEENKSNAAAAARRDGQGEDIKRMSKARRMNAAYKQIKEQSKYLDIKSGLSRGKDTGE